MASNNNKNLLRNENDYNLNYVKLVDWKGKEYEFQQHIGEFSYEESIFETFIHGSVFVSDAVDFPTLLPMMGQERFKASFTRADEKPPAGSDGRLLDPISFDMCVYLMDGKRQESGSGKHQTYTLYYTSEEIFKNLNTKVFKAFRSKKYSDMVKLVYESYLKINKKINIEESNIEVDYCIQNEHPIRSINKIAKRAVPKLPTTSKSGESEPNSNGYFYVFYEDKDQFNFVSIGSLIKQTPIAKLSYELKNILENTDGLGHKSRDVEKDMSNVSNYQQQGTFDVLTQAMSGEAASSMLALDPILRTFSVKEFDLRKEFDKFPHVDKSKPFVDDHRMFVSPLANMSMIIGDSGHPNNDYIKAKDPTAKSFLPEEFFLHRQSQKKQLLKNIITLTLSGNPRIKAGSMIEFNVPEHLGKTGQNNPEQKDQYLQGKYLVVSVAHILKIGKYTMNLEIIKDTYFSDIKHRDPVQEYKNIY